MVDCLGSANSPTVIADCNTVGNGFGGFYKKGTAMASGNTFKVTLTNNSFSPATISFSASDLTLSGIPGISVSSVSPTSATLNEGASQTVTYTLGGTPTSCGTLTGNWQKIALNCTKTIAVDPNPTYTCSGGSWSTAVSPASYKLNGLMSGQVYSGIYSIPYTGGECSLPSETISSNGLTLTYTGGSVPASGTIDYVLSGTYTGTDNGSASFTTKTGCIIYLGPCASCKEILGLGLASADGVYNIDPDQTGTAFSTMKAQCDMTTDGGGWTLILNYLHSAGTTPIYIIKNTSLPLIGSYTLGTNEGGDANFWGNAGLALQTALNSTEYRFYGITSNHSRVMHFKTSHVGSLTYFKTGTGSANGIQSSFTALAGHTTFLPAQANLFSSGNPPGAELVYFPFYRGNTYHWGIGATIGRWEVDDFAVNPNTLHRVWVR